MGVTNYTLGPFLQNEANKCWFYAISFSILLSLYQWFGLAFITPTTKDTQKSESSKDEDETKAEAAKFQVDKDAAYAQIHVQLAIDGCDLLIPGYSVGWIPVDQTAVGVAQFISSALAARQIWRRVQAMA